VVNTKAGEELLAGFHLHDPAFEDWLRDERLRFEDTAAPSDQPAGLSLPEKPSIAVLPFVNMSGDPEQEYFSDGITEDIITGLSRFRELFVIARNSSFTYKGRPVKVQDIGEELGVRYVVEGSVRKAGKRVRITAQLVDVATGNHLWAERYDREMEDVFAIQDEVTETVVATLAGRLGDLGVDYAKRKPTHSLTAFDYVLHARQLIYRYKRESILEARALLEKAIALDPEYAIAHAWLSETYWAEWLGGWTTNADASFEQSARAAAQAVALDDTDPYVHVQMGQICLDRRQYDEARFHFDKALSLNPNEPNALMMKSYYSSCVGDPERAVAQINEAIRVDPLGHYGFMAGIAHYTARDYEHAMAAFKIVRGEAQGIHAWLAACHAQSGNLDDARASASEFVARATKAMADAGARPPASWRAFFAVRHPYKHQDDMDHLLDGLSRAGLD
jgi:adenylate cyclase